MWSGRVTASDLNGWKVVLRARYLSLWIQQWTNPGDDRYMGGCGPKWVSVLGNEVRAAEVSVAVPFSQCSCWDLTWNSDAVRVQSIFWYLYPNVCVCIHRVLYKQVFGWGFATSNHRENWVLTENKSDSLSTISQQRDISLKQRHELNL